MKLTDISITFELTTPLPVIAVIVVHGGIVTSTSLGASIINDLTLAKRHTIVHTELWNGASILTE